MSDIDTPIARGKRLRALRELTNLTRKAIERKHGLSANTLNAWESGIRAGLTKEGARRIVYIFKSEGIDCSTDWLLYGKGEPCKRKAPLQITAPVEAPSPAEDHENIPAEVAYFLSNNIEAVTFEVEDDTMYPWYRVGDTVGGIRRYGDEAIKYFIHQDCIVETIDNKSYFRRLNLSTIPNHYNLIALNSDTRVERPVIYEVQLLNIAPVTRIWRGKKWFKAQAIHSQRNEQS